MDKNSIIGWVLIGAIFIGFMFFQSKQAEKQMRYQAQLDSIARVENLARMQRDSIERARMLEADTLGREAFLPVDQPVYKDSLLEASSKAEGTLITLSNGKLDVTFTTKGAQPYSVHVKDYLNYDKTPLYIVREGASSMGYSIYTGENINTKDFVFEVVSRTDSSLVMRLPFHGGSYIQQTYVLRKDSYEVSNEMAFVGMNAVIPANVSVMDFDWTLDVPRMEKGFKNESQYSFVDYYFTGDKKPGSIGRGRSGSKKINNRMSWFAFHQQFFSAIMRAEDEFSSGALSLDFYSDSDPQHRLMACEASNRYDYGGGADCRIRNEFYFGPNHYNTLKKIGYSYEKIIPLGGWLVGWFTKWVIIPLFDFLHGFINSFGLIILLMTIVIKLVVSPLSYKSYASTAKMQAIKPELDLLNEKYPKPDDAMKKQQAQMDLYKRAGINPMGGCLPMLLQFPILWAMFRFFPASIELRQQKFLWAEDLSAYDSIVDFGVNIPLLGDHISLFALLMALSMFFYSKITMTGQSGGDDPNAKMMRFMSLYMMPVMMFFVCNNLSSGLSYYYLVSNLLTMVMTWVIKKFFVHPDEIRQKVQQSYATSKAPVKSKWEQRLEEMQKQQRQMQKQQGGRNGRRG